MENDDALCGLVSPDGLVGIRWVSVVNLMLAKMEQPTIEGPRSTVPYHCKLLFPASSARVKANIIQGVCLEQMTHNPDEPETIPELRKRE